MRPRKLLILGAGPTGLGAAHALLESRHEEWLVYERNDHVGGLSASFRDAARFTWDIGGHVVFSRYPEFDRFFDEMTQGEVYSHERRSYIRLAGRFVPYPFQNNIRHLPPALLEECLEGLERAAARGQTDTSDFLAWNLSRLGQGITRLFIEPDNRKRWACPAQRLSTDWVADRVSPVDLERIRENIRLGRDDVSWGPNNRFHFPKRGGTGAIFEAMAPRLGDRLRLARQAIEIDPRRRIVRFAPDGQEVAYDALLSSMPIDRLARMIRGAPESLVERAKGLRYANSLIVGIGFRGPCPSEKCWVYCPELAAPFFRATYLSNYSPHNAPDAEHYSIMCDASYSDLTPLSRESIVERTIAGLLEVGLISSEERERIVSTHVIDAPYSYPVPTPERDAILADLHDWLEPLGIHSRGRMGAWLYEAGNMDHSVVMGMQWARSVLKGERESVWMDRK